jgi:peptidoglycan/LPS O-acetylase OafA/YrhL
VGGSQFLKEVGFADLPWTDQLGLALALASSNGTSMVIVFFVLSGFIISYSYQKNRWTYKQFLVNRAIRIYIPYIAAALLAGLFLWLAFNMAEPVFRLPIKDYHERIGVAYSEGLTIQNFFKTLFFAKNERINYFGFNYVFWSLLYEVLFYLLFPLIIKYCKYIFLCAGLFYPLHFIYNPLPEINHWYFYFTEYLFYFTGGVLLFHYYTSQKEKGMEKRFLFRKPVLSIVLLTSFLLVVLGVSSRLKDLSFLAAAIFGAAWILRVMLYGIENNLLSKSLLFLGTISYSLYLVHIPLLLLAYSSLFYFFGWHTYSSPWIHLLLAIATLPFAYLFYLLFEKWSIILINRHKKTVHSQPVEANLNPIKTS